MSRARIAVLTGLLLACAPPLWAASEQTLAELGVEPEKLTATQAERLLERYVSGEILSAAPLEPRIELLEALRKVAPEGSTLRTRVDLMLRSARTSSWPGEGEGAGD